MGASLTRSVALTSTAGLLCFLLNIRDPAELASSPLRGAVFETATYTELRKRLSRVDELASLFFYRDRALEVDFVLHRGGRFALLESKWTELPDAADAASMDRLARTLGEDRILSRQLVCRTEQAFPLGEARAVGLAELELA